MREAVILTNLGESAHRMGDPQEAIRVLSDAEGIGAALGDRILEAEILRGLAEAHTLLGDLESARTAIERSVDLFAKARGKPFLGVALRTLAEVEAASGDDARHRNAAEKAFRRSLALFEELGNEVELAHTCQSFSAFLERTAGGDEARDRESRTLRERSLEIHGKQLASESYALPPLDGDSTNPNIAI